MLAYPGGSRSAFTGTTEQVAKNAGYRLCFSFYGGVNVEENVNTMNIFRMSADHRSLIFRAKIILHAVLGRSPY
jgi:hypothetical protein